MDDNHLVTEPGATIEFTEVSWGEFEWMHGYMFIDFNNDGDYIADLDASNKFKPKSTSELVSFSYYTNSTTAKYGYNSNGEYISEYHGKGKIPMPSFTLPEDLKPGTYNCLFKIDWNDITQCGDQIESGSGAAVEFCIEIPGPADLNEICDFAGYANGADNLGRSLTSFTLTDGANNQKYTVNQTTGDGDSVFYDLTGGDALVTEQGKTIEFSEFTWNGAWMHYYLFVDYDRDGHYMADLNTSVTPYTMNPGNELVVYSFYNINKASDPKTGYNSNGVSNVSYDQKVAQHLLPLKFTIPDDLTPGRYKCYLKIDWNDITECGDQIERSCGVAVEFPIEVQEAAAEPRLVSVKSNDESMGTVSIKDQTGTSVTTVGPVTVVATPMTGFSFYNWTKEGSDVVLGEDLEYTYSDPTEATLVATFGELKYPTMTHTYTNGSDQANRYLKSVTTVGTQTPVVFECTSEEQLPVTPWTANAGSYVKEGANIEKLDNPIRVMSGTNSFQMTYKAWTDNINGRASELNWTQEAYFVDWNGDGFFSGATEISGKGVTDMGNNNPITTTGLTRTVTIPDGQQPGTYRMRVVFYEPATSSDQWQNNLFTTLQRQIRNGVSYDFLIQIIQPSLEITRKSVVDDDEIQAIVSVTVKGTDLGDDAVINVDYSVDGGEYAPMTLVEGESYTVTIPYDEYEIGTTHTVKVKATALRDEQEIASAEEITAGKFTVPDEDLYEPVPPVRDYSVSIGSVSLAAEPYDDPCEAHVYAFDITTGEDLEDPELEVSYRLNDGDYVEMDYYDSKNYFYGYIPFDGLDLGDYDVYVKVVANRYGKYVSETEEHAGHFTIWTVKNTDGITDVAADIAAGARYFNLQGAEVSNPSAGLYIRVQGDTASKVIVK